jgi:hypothetical protein
VPAEVLGRTVENLKEPDQGADARAVVTVLVGGEHRLVDPGLLGHPVLLPAPLKADTEEGGSNLAGVSAAVRQSVRMAAKTPFS